MKMGVRSKERKPKTLMQTYVTSMLSLLLSCAMLLSTTMAWFTSSVTSKKHEIYVGILDVDLENEEGSLKEKQDIMLFDAGYDLTSDEIKDGKNFKWEPGATAVEVLTVEDLGDLAFNYELTLKCESVMEKQADGTFVAVADAEKASVRDAVAKSLNVYAIPGEHYSSGTLRGTIDALCATDADDDGKKDYLIGTLLDVISGKAVFSGSSPEMTDKKSTYTVVLQMPGEETEGIVGGVNIMGKKLTDITVELVATQMDYEKDSFGPDYDVNVIGPRALVKSM